MSIYCDVYETKEIIIEGDEKARVFINKPTCMIDIDYSTTLKDDCFEVHMEMLATIKDGEETVLSCKAPFILRHTLVDYEKHGRQNLVMSAFREIEEDGYKSIQLTIGVFLFSIIQAKERSIT